MVEAPHATGMVAPVKTGPLHWHIPQPSISLRELTTPSHPRQVEVSPPQTPQGSRRGAATGHVPTTHVERPPHTPHTSYTAPPFGTLLQSEQVLLSPPHTPHSSTTAPPLMTPKQSVQDELSPPHTPHASFTTVPKGVPLQSRHDVPLPSHTLHTSFVLGPFGTPAQSAQVELSPPHTPQASTVLLPKGTPSHPLGTVTAAKLTPPSVSEEHTTAPEARAAGEEASKTETAPVELMYAQSRARCPSLLSRRMSSATAVALKTGIEMEARLPAFDTSASVLESRVTSTKGDTTSTPLSAVQGAKGDALEVVTEIEGVAVMLDGTTVTCPLVSAASTVILARLCASFA
mmetsp:Transcript_25880/g.65543  ORF Transcript_25880/g.65543 Transcript_25880/m.65543 type:complete len:346 (-) Transcript_25880:5590-6627(-)